LFHCMHLFCRYKGEGRVAQKGNVSPRWVEGELLVFSGASPLTAGAGLGFVFAVGVCNEMACSVLLQLQSLRRLAHPLCPSTIARHAHRSPPLPQPPELAAGQELWRAGAGTHAWPNPLMLIHGGGGGGMGAGAHVAHTRVRSCAGGFGALHTTGSCHNVMPLTSGRHVRSCAGARRAPVPDPAQQAGPGGVRAKGGRLAGRVGRACCTQQPWVGWLHPPLAALGRVSGVCVCTCVCMCVCT